MAGSFGYELDLNNLSEEEKTEVAEQIVRFKQYSADNSKASPHQSARRHRCILQTAHRDKLSLTVLTVHKVLKHNDAAFHPVCRKTNPLNTSHCGGRFDAGMLYYCPQIWCSDDTDAYERTKIQYGTSFFYPKTIFQTYPSSDYSADNIFHYESMDHIA